MQDFVKKLTVNEMAELLRRSPKQFRVDVKKYNIPHIKIGGRKLFDYQEVENSLKVYASESNLFAANAQNKKPSKKDTKDENKNDKKAYYEGLLGLR